MNAATTEPRTWNYKVIVLALLLGAWLQREFLLAGSGPALDTFWRGRIFQAALLFDVLVVVRILVAAIARERSRSWIFYSVLCLSSFL